MLETLQWLESHEIEVLVTDLPRGVAAQYYAQWRQLVVADDLDDLAMNNVLQKVQAEVLRRLESRAVQIA